MSYAQFEDPSNAGVYESVSCTVRYDRSKSYADFSDVEVQNYYGSSLLKHGEPGVKDQLYKQLNVEDQRVAMVWGKD